MSHGEGFRMSARHRLKKYLLENIGRVVDGSELASVAGIDSWTRRVRELRDEEGMQISSHLDRSDLRPGQYVLETAELRPQQLATSIPRDLRLNVIERDGFTCRKCGRTKGDKDPGNLDRPITLYIEQSDSTKAVQAVSLWVVCSVCAADRSNPILKHDDLLSQVRRASRSEQLAALEWLKRKFERGHTR